MHSFKVDIWICQPKNSDVHRVEGEVNITFEGWLILMITEKDAPIVLLYDRLSSFVLFKVCSYFINLLKSDYSSALKIRLLSNNCFLSF